MTKMQNHNPMEINFSDKSDYVPGISEIDITNICDDLKIEIKHEPVEDCWDAICVNNKFDDKERDFKKRESEIKYESQYEVEPEESILRTLDVPSLIGANVNADVKFEINHESMDGNRNIIYRANRLDDEKIDDFNKGNLKEDIKIEIKHEALECELMDVYNSKEFDEVKSKYNNSDLELKTSYLMSHQCNYCNKAFASNDDYLCHMKEHTEEKLYMCNQCEKQFSKKSSLSNHLKTHTGDKSNKCSDCNMAFYEKCNLKKHKQTHPGEKVCQCHYFEKTFPPNNELFANKMDHTWEESRHKCNQCEKVFSCGSDLTKHFKTHADNKPYQCSDCNKSFTHKCNLTRHKKTHSGNNRHQCSHCDKVYATKDYLMKHLITHTEGKCNKFNNANEAKDIKIEIKHEPVVGDSNLEYTNNEVDKEKLKYINRNKEIKQENQYNAKLYSSLFVPCDLKKPIIDNIKLISGKGDEIKIKQEPMECAEAMEACTGKDNDVDENLYINGELSIKQEENVKDELDKNNFGLEKPLIGYDKSSIDGNNDNEIHIKNEVGIYEESFLVEDTENVCKKENHTNKESMAFINQNFVEKNKKANSKENPKLGKNNDKAVTDSDKLMNYMKFNAGEKHYQCYKCNKVFPNVISRRIHVKTHISDKPYQCIDCGMSFSQKFNLRQHQIIHMKEKPHQCTYCDKSFTRKDNLKIHQMTHTENMSYQSSHSKELFSNKSDFRRTQNKQIGRNYPNHTSQFGKALGENNQSISNFGIHTDNKTYQCNHCDMSFSENDEFKIHLGTHTEEKPFKCSDCDRAFSVNDHLRRHLMIHAKEKPYQCHKCDESFLDNASLIRHLSTHSGKSTYQCSQCNKQFLESSHINGEKINMCKHCNKTYSKDNDPRIPHHKTPAYKGSRSRRTKYKESQHIKQDEDSQVIYVGCIADGTTSEIRDRFKKFGTIKDISITFRGQRNNYGFIKFSDQIEACQAIEYGNDDTFLPQYYICSKKKYDEDKLREQRDDHRVIFVGCIAEGTTKAELRDRFRKFGTIRDVALIFGGLRNNYSHIRFSKRNEAFEAIKHGNNDTALPYYYLCLKDRVKYEEDEFVKKKQDEDRKTLYIGCIANGTTKDEIRDRFSKFGTIMDISMIFKGQRNNYGFITYSDNYDVHKAIKHGNDDTSLPQYYICQRRRYEEDKLVEQADDPRVMFIGCIAEGTSKVELRNRFSKHGTIKNICIIFNGQKNNYGHINFSNRHDAYTAIEHGNDNTSLPHYYLSLRGSRKYEEEKFIEKQGEDRKIIYITDMTEETTSIDLRERFGKFGTITYISLLSKGQDSNFGFIAFKKHEEAYKAVKHGNDDTSLPRYYISLGGRRMFCKRSYSDLDSQNVANSELSGPRSGDRSESREASMDFDDLLKAAMKKKR